MARRRADLYVGDVARIIRESLRVVVGPVALVTVTPPGGEWSRADAAEWNRGQSRRWRLFRARLSREMWRRHGQAPPRVVCWVAQRQGRGLDHLHLVMLARTADQCERIRLWVVLYRELHLAYGFGFVDDPFHERRSRKTGKRQNMVFARADVAGIYLGNYLAGGQLERFVQASDRSWRPYWVSPALMRRSGWSMARCRMVRQAWICSRGEWGVGRIFGGLVSRRPSWWYRPDDRAWVCSVTGWDGISFG